MDGAGGRGAERDSVAAPATAVGRFRRQAATRVGAGPRSALAGAGGRPLGGASRRDDHAKTEEGDRGAATCAWRFHRRRTRRGGPSGARCRPRSEASDHRRDRPGADRTHRRDRGPDRRRARELDLAGGVREVPCGEEAGALMMALCGECGSRRSCAGRGHATPALLHRGGGAGRYPRRSCAGRAPTTPGAPAPGLWRRVSGRVLWSRPR